ncbi:MAG: carboxypeptidase regulatory-like domain-containing protein, partial [Acidobacteria bacterium]|nr:carboxypeptidase regulatory-like domain-containing protein [Acidobacteriota bacterium]
MRQRLVALVTFSGFLLAQAPTGEIVGAVTDPSGAAVSGAAVTVSNPATNMQRAAATNEAGIFAVPALPPGTYTVKVEAQGFATQVRSEIELQVGQIARFDFNLRVGNVSEIIEVQGGAPVLETETTSLGAVIENRRIVELPLNGRNYLQLASLIPGATTAASPSVVNQLRMGGARADFTLVVSGQRLSYNHYTLDGVENTDVNFGSYYLLPSIDALQEFRVETGLFPAEYGRGTSQVNVTTRTGTNAFHGSVFEFVRNAKFDAKNFFDRPAAPIPPFKRNQFGAVVGGPVVRDKVFFMANFEGLRERKALTQVATVPVVPQRAGDFSGFRPVYDPASRVFNAAGQVVSTLPFANSLIPANRIHRVARRVLDGFVPVPNSTVSPGAGLYVNDEGRRSDSDQFTARGDWAQNASSSWFARFSRSKDLGYVPAILPVQGNDVEILIRQGMFGNTRVIGSNKVNELRLGVTHMSAFNRQTRAF